MKISTNKLFLPHASHPWLDLPRLKKEVVEVIKLKCPVRPSRFRFRAGLISKFSNSIFKHAFVRSFSPHVLWKSCCQREPGDHHPFQLDMCIRNQLLSGLDATLKFTFTGPAAASAFSSRQGGVISGIIFTFNELICCLRDESVWYANICTWWHPFKCVFNEQQSVVAICRFFIEGIPMIKIVQHSNVQDIIPISSN